jgi:nitrate/nitrite transport system ATP-binding protein
MSFLELESVSMSYRANGRVTEVLRDLHLQIEQGEFVAIVGYSGAGKTTLISLIAGLLAPESGTVRLNGVKVTGPGPDRGMVFQNYSLLPWLTVYENIELAVDQVFPDWAPERRRAQVERHIAMVNLMPARDRRPPELSGGMRQRVSVARALAMDPQILLLDEPLSALDALTRASLQDEIARIWQEQKKTVVLITNDVDEGLLLADRIVPLTAGPDATLGPSFPVSLARPRSRHALNHDPRCVALRAEIISWLTASAGQRHLRISRKLVLPDLEPEDLSVPQPWLGGRRGPLRRREVKRAEVEVPR